MTTRAAAAKYINAWRGEGYNSLLFLAHSQSHLPERSAAAYVLKFCCVNFLARGYCASFAALFTLAAVKRPACYFHLRLIVSVHGDEKAFVWRSKSAVSIWLFVFRAGDSREISFLFAAENERREAIFSFACLHVRARELVQY